MRYFTLIVMSAMALATTAPAFAENGTAKQGILSGAMAHKSAADTRRMDTCNAMSHKRMMRSATCRRLVQMQADMMHHKSKMQPAPAMAPDNKM